MNSDDFLVDGLNGSAHPLGGARDSHFVPVAQADQLVVLRAEFLDAALQGLHPEVGLFKEPIRFAVQQFRGGLTEEDSARRVPLAHAEDLVAGDGVPPCREARARRERVESGLHQQDRLLEQILRISVVRDHRQNEGVDPPLVRHEQTQKLVGLRRVTHTDTIG